MIQTIKNKVVGVGLFLLPMVASAAATDTFFTKVAGFTNDFIGLLLGVATLVFLYGVILYVIAGADESKATTAKSYMLYGVIGLLIMVAVWGLVNLLVDTLGLDTTTVPPLPTF